MDDKKEGVCIKHCIQMPPSKHDKCCEMVENPKVEAKGE